MSLGYVGIPKGQISTANLVIFFLFSKSSMKIPLLGWEVVDKYSSAEAIGRLKKEPTVGRRCDLPWVASETYCRFFRRPTVGRFWGAREVACGAGCAGGLSLALECGCDLGDETEETTAPPRALRIEVVGELGWYLGTTYSQSLLGESAVYLKRARSLSLRTRHTRHVKR